MKLTKNNQDNVQNYFVFVPRYQGIHTLIIDYESLNTCVLVAWTIYMDFWILFNIPHTVIYTYCSKYAKLYKIIYISVKFASIHWRFYKGRVIKLTEFMMLFLERAYTFESAFPRRKIFPSRRYFVWSEILPTSSLRHVKKKSIRPK